MEADKEFVVEAAPDWREVARFESSAAAQAWARRHPGPAPNALRIVGATTRRIQTFN